MQAYKKSSIILFSGVIELEAGQKLTIAPGKHVFLTEGRPSLEAGKENSKFFLGKKIAPTVISDNMAGFLFANDYVHEVVLACQYADKAGALCDTGALIYAVLAKRHKVPVKLVKSKLRTRFLGDPKSILNFENVTIAPKGTSGYVPLVEWVPGKYLKSCLPAGREK